MASEGSVSDVKSKEVIISGKDEKLDTKEDVADLLKSIEECEGLTTLKLSGNSFGVEAMKAVGELLARKPQLTRALWSDMFVSRLRSEIPLALMSLGEGVMAAQACLTELDLSDNAFGPTGVEPLVGFLTSPSCFTLKILRFNNNGLGINGGTLLAGALLDCHEEAKKAGQRLSLEVFVAGRNRLENEGATALSQFFEVLGTLVHVSMPQNGINPPGVSALAKAFVKNPNLRVIDLNDNTVTEEGSIALAAALPSLQELRTLNLGDCLVRNDGAKAVMEAIKNGHRQLQELNLSFCELDGDAVLSVADALANKEDIKKIDLNGNCFGNEGIELLKESLEAKGLGEALESLSDDEGLSDDEEEDEQEEEEEEEERNEGVPHRTEDVEPTDEKEGDLSTDEKLQVKGVAISPEKNFESDSKDDEHSQETTSKQILLDEFLALPTGDNLVALGDNRAQLIIDSLVRGSTEAAPLPEDVAAMYVKVASLYIDNCDTGVKQVVESTIDALLKPLFKEGKFSVILNEILVQVGLIKCEDKKFKPVTDVEGPLLALTHVVRQQYFPRPSADMLIKFLTKPSPVLDTLLARGTVQKLLQVLHTL